MKKLVCLLWAAVLAVFVSGCQPQPKALLLVPPEDPGSDLVAYDPDRQVYFNAEAVYMDYYVGVAGVPYFDMLLYSKTYLRPSAISVSFPVDAPIKAEVTPVKGIKGKTEYTADEDDLPENVLRYYVYAAYRGGNPAALADAKITNKMNIGVRDPLRAEYEALLPENLPDVYAYHIRVDLSQVPEPEPGMPWTLETIRVTVKGQTYESKLGGVRLHNAEDFVSRSFSDAVTEQAGVYTANANELYSGGVVKLPRICIFHEDMEYDNANMLAAWMLEEDSRILKATLTVVDADGNEKTVDRLSQGLTFYKGESVYLDLTIQNKNADQFLASNQYHLVIETYDYTIYESAEAVRPGKNTSRVYTFVCAMNTCHYENHAIIFDGVDMEPYYDYYYEYFCADREYR